MNRNYVMAPTQFRYINTSWNGGQFCGSNGQCSLFQCQEWEDDIHYQPELIRDERGFAICPKCNASYGEAALTGEEYRAEVTKRNLAVFGNSLPE